MRTFEELRGTATWNTTLAYWVGNYRGPDEPGELLSLARVMSLQYDFEAQADRHGRVFPEDNDWTTRFAPVAPVQLALGWSPVPRAIELLGAPAVEAFELEGDTHTVTCAWAPPSDLKVTARRLRAARPTSPDDKRLVELLTATAMRTHAKASRILLVARPGWSYERAGIITPRTESLMKRAGFVVADRRYASG
jgi:hypothetical protein